MSTTSRGLLEAPILRSFRARCLHGRRCSTTSASPNSTLAAARGTPSVGLLTDALSPSVNGQRRPPLTLRPSFTLRPSPSPLILHPSPFTLTALALYPHRSSLTAHRSPLITPRLLLTAHRSHRSPLTAHTAHRSPLTPLTPLMQVVSEVWQASSNFGTCSRVKALTFNP